MTPATASIDTARRRRPDPAPAGTRVPPHNLVAEESLLGAMLLSREAIASALEVGLSSADFYKPSHGHVFDAVTTLYAQGEPADPVTVAEVLRRAGVLDAIGGPSILISLQAGTPSIGNATRYARIVEEHALLRRLIGVAGNIAEIGYGLPDDVTAAVDEAEALVFEVAQRRVTDSLSPIRVLLDRQLDRLEQLYECGEEITGVATVPAEKYFTLARPEPGWQRVWQNMEMARYAAAAPFPVQPVVVLLDPDSPAGGFTRDWSRLDAGISVHQGYAFQWFMLAAALASIYLFMSLRRRGAGKPEP